MFSRNKIITYIRGSCRRYNSCNAHRISKRTISDQASETTGEKTNWESLLTIKNLVESDPLAAERIGRILSNSTLLELESALKTESLVQTQPVIRPSNEQLGLVCLTRGLPFIGFGLIDNAVMILAGDMIDVRLGVTLGISTMASAALGNTFSDQLGIGLGGLVEAAATKAGIPTPTLSRAQENLRITKLSEHFGALVGITIGCLLGMFPLLFIDTDEAIKKRNENDPFKYLLDVEGKLSSLPVRTSPADLSSLNEKINEEDEVGNRIETLNNN